MRKDTYCFPHDSNAKDDAEIATRPPPDRHPIATRSHCDRHPIASKGE